VARQQEQVLPTFRRPLNTTPGFSAFPSSSSLFRGCEGQRGALRDARQLKNHLASSEIPQLSRFKLHGGAFKLAQS